MASVTRPHLVTADEFLAGPERPGVLLIDGEVFLNDATISHQRLCARVFAALVHWIESPGGGGEVGWGGNWVLDAMTVVKPDVWWKATRPPGLTRLEGPPDLAIEVLSPSTRHLDLGRKRDRYREAGLDELWLVDARSETVVALRFTGGDATLDRGDDVTSPQLPGFSLSVDTLFADLE